MFLVQVCAFVLSAMYMERTQSGTAKSWHMRQLLWFDNVHVKQVQLHRQIVTCRPLKDTLSGHEGKGLMKVVVNSQNDRVVGIHLVGAEVAEILQVTFFHPCS